MYQVSNLGNIRSLNAYNHGIIKIIKPKIHHKTGTYEIRLSKNGVRKDYTVGRLVAEAFIPNPLFKEKVMHLSTNRLDNSVENLAWAYTSEVNHNVYNVGQRKSHKSTNTKITYNGKCYKNYIQIARDLGINKSTFYGRLYKLNWNLYEALEVPIGREE